MSIMRRASSTPVSPHALKNGVLPPNVAAPSDRTGTRSPERPRNRYSIIRPLPPHEGVEHAVEGRLRRVLAVEEQRRVGGERSVDPGGRGGEAAEGPPVEDG